MDYYKRALELNDETIKNRRYFHMNAEAGLHMPMACVYVMDKLTEYGLVPSRCGEKPNAHSPIVVTFEGILISVIL